jgi:hypothetical protein
MNTTKLVASAVRATALLLGTTSAALAGTFGAFEFSDAPSANTVVAAISDRVTYSKPAESLTTYVAFNVGSGPFLFKNISGNTINRVTITFTATVTDSAEKLKLFAPQVYLAGLPGCTFPLTAQNALSFSCTIAQAKAGDSFPSFTVFYEAPAKVTGGSGVGDAPDTDKVKLDIRVAYAERDNGGNPQPNSVVTIPMETIDAVTLGTENPTLVKTAVPKSGGAFFTGISAVTTDNDRFATKLSVPEAVKVSKAQIDEQTCGDGVNFFFTCWQAVLTIQDTAAEPPVPTNFSPNYLTIVVRQDAKNIRPGTKIDSVLIDYINDDGVAYPAIGDCASPTTPRTDGIPCIAARKHYKNRSVSGWTTALDGDFEWTLLNIKNGSIRFPN